MHSIHILWIKGSRGFDADCIIVDEASFVSKELLMDTIIPVLGQGMQRRAAAPRQRCAAVPHIFLTFFYIVCDATA